MAGGFDADSFNGDIGGFDVGVLVSASNWQADYWKRRSRKQREEDERLQRIELGILPPEEREAALEAVLDADNASRELAAGSLGAGQALYEIMEARRRFDEIYQQVYRDAYIASVVAELWKEDMKRIARRRKAIALLLH